MAQVGCLRFPSLQLPPVVHGTPEHLVGFLVADEALLLGVPLELLLEAPGDVGQEAQGGGMVCGVDVGHRVLAAAHAVEEVVLMMIGIGQLQLVEFDFELEQRLGLGPDSGAVYVDPTPVADEPCSALLLLGVGEDHLQPAGVGEGRVPAVHVVREAFLAVGGLARDFKGLGAQLRAAPVGDVEMVDAPVADEPGAVVPDQVPVGPGDAARVVGLRRSGPAPHLPVEAGRDRLRVQRALVLGTVFGPGAATSTVWILPT